MGKKTFGRGPCHHSRLQDGAFVLGDLLSPLVVQQHRLGLSGHNRLPCRGPEGWRTVRQAFLPLPRVVLGTCVLAYLVCAPDRMSMGSRPLATAGSRHQSETQQASAGKRAPDCGRLPHGGVLEGTLLTERGACLSTFPSSPPKAASAADPHRRPSDRSQWRPPADRNWKCLEC